MPWFLTFHTYGTYHPTPEHWDAYRRARMQSAPFYLDAPRRAAVLTAIREIAARQNWELKAVHVRTTHVHLLTAADAPGRSLIGHCKCHATHLLRQANLAAPTDRIWAQGGYARLLTNDQAEQSAETYILEDQGPPMSHFAAPAETH